MSGAPLARHVNLAVSPTLAAALESTGDKSMSGLSENQKLNVKSRSNLQTLIK